MAESVVSFLLDNLSVWIQQEQELNGGLKSEVEYIRGEMGQMRAFLRVADGKEESDPQLKEWVRQVREIAYDTRDVLEKYMLLRFAHGGAQGFRGRIKKTYASIKNLKFRRAIASEIQTIKSRIENVSKSQQRFRDLYAIMDQGSTSNDSSDAHYDGRGDALLVEEADVVGIEKPKKQLLEWLGSNEHGLKVIAVFGMGGLGKTTLVKKAYDDAKLMMSFHHHVWITVSETFKIEHLLRGIISQIVEEVKQPPPQGLEVMNADGMREFIYKSLQHKNYLIVLDDVWKIHAWEAIRYAFPRSDTRGCGTVIVTTRLISIANATCSETGGHMYNLEPLAMEESKMLFYRKAFPRMGQCPPYLEEVARNILKRCNGLPLAIVVIGGLLATKHNKLEEWQMFNHSISHELGGDELKRVTKLLSLSYYDLPYYLKSCYLYLSIFPADHVLEKYELIRLWVAEGFVQAKEGKTLEEIAEGYLNELVNRSLLQVVDVKFSGEKQSRFRIHDLLQEYIVSKSREENVVTVESGEDDFIWPNKIRRLAIHNSLNCTKETDNFKYLRTIISLGSLDSESCQSLQKILRGGSDMLKVLDLRAAPLETIPDEVFKFYLLKYLSLRDTKVNHVPKTIGNLQNIETLDLKEACVTELPVEILKLRRLRHLFAYKYLDSGNKLPHEFVQGFKAPYKIGCLSSLQGLWCIEAGQCDDGAKIVGEIGKLTQLRGLGITKVRRDDVSELCSSLAKLTKLRILSVSSLEEEVMDLDYTDSSGPSSTWPFLQNLILNGCLEKLPQWVPSLDSLTTLVLSYSGLREDPLEYLQNLPNLLCLQILVAYEGERLSFNVGGFQRLKELSLCGLGALRWVRIVKGSMPFLQRFYMQNCKLVTGLPEGMEHLTNLQTVEFVDMEEAFVASLKEHKSKEAIAHISNRQIYNWVDDQWKVAEI